MTFVICENKDSVQLSSYFVAQKSVKVKVRFQFHTNTIKLIPRIFGGRECAPPSPPWPLFCKHALQFMGILIENLKFHLILRG